jgi:hypothetical protein
LRLNTRDVIVLEAFFTRWSDLIRQEMELNQGLQDQQMDLFSHPDSTKEMIPQLLWAKIKARRQFFLTTCTRAMLDRPAEGHPTIARATLNTHALLFLLGTKVSIVGVPHQWLRQEEHQGPAKKARHATAGHEGTNSNGPLQNDGRYGTTGHPWAQEETGGKPAAPPAATQWGHRFLHNPRSSMTYYRSSPR